MSDLYALMFPIMSRILLDYLIQLRYAALCGRANGERGARGGRLSYRSLG